MVLFPRLNMLAGGKMKGVTNDEEIDSIRGRLKTSLNLSHMMEGASSR